MYQERRRYRISLVIIGFFFSSNPVFALKADVGVGAGIEYTDNATLRQDNTISDQIASAYAGVRMAENEGPLTYDVKATINKYTYLQNSYSDQRRFALALNSDWDMIPQRFNWILSDIFRQRTIDPVESNTPDNLEDSNAFKFGANIYFPVSSRQDINLRPMFSQYYYEQSTTDNKQYSLNVGWGYKLVPTTDVGIDLGVRNIDYLDQVLSDTTFTNASFVVSGERVSSNYSIHLGATNVQRDNPNGPDLDDTGFSGSLNYAVDLSSRSELKTHMSSDLTDTSSVISGASGNADDVQLSTDVVRNKMINLAYQRYDEELRSSIWAEYRKLTYNGGQFDREIRSSGIKLDYSLTQLLSTGAFAHYSRTNQLDASSREDTRIAIGGDIKYRMSSKLHSKLEVKYRTKDSTDVTKEYDEVSVFASLVYGFGGVTSSTRTGDF